MIASATEGWLGVVEGRPVLPGAETSSGTDRVLRRKRVEPLRQASIGKLVGTEPREVFIWHSPGAGPALALSLVLVAAYFAFTVLIAVRSSHRQTSSNSLNAAGASATNSSLTTTFGGQVIDVLPNGMLVIEAARQVEFSQQVQTIVLRGLVRPEDISQQNQVVSTAISSLELQVRGKGIINDYTHRQNVLVRMLRDILVF